ncbi:hypothetical protein BP6252_12489 [Coleophoma cylindrospora]|uniref:AAA+ ATPase domain-containing protein n=1 Tax=Coleophoma cylindrospora TaxID=1849047 RepID=A0A3D8QGZ0_9HELO|nr:hypothetical protein BP6252_12489 [Coleophoma cylindrospora]
MPPFLTSSPSLGSPPDLNDAAAKKAKSMSSSLVNRHRRPLDERQPISKEKKKTENRNIRFVLSDGLRTISSWKSPLIESPPETGSGTGKGDVFDLFMAIATSPSAEGAQFVNFEDSDSTISSGDDDTESEVEMGVTRSASKANSVKDFDIEVARDGGSDEKDMATTNDARMGVDNDETESGNVSDIPPPIPIFLPSRTGRRAARRDRQKSWKPPPRPAEVRGMYVNSPYLQKTLRYLVSYYPAQVLSGKFIAIDFPFKVLWHYHRQLTELQKHYSEQTSSSIVSGDEDPKFEDPMKTAEHISVLLDYLEPRYLDVIKPAEERHQDGVASYNTLWLLFKPGCDVYARVGGMLAGLIFSSMKEDSIHIEDRVHGTKRWKDFWTVKAWHLNYVNGKLVRVPRSFKINKFDGEKEITTLPIFPADCLNTVDNGKTRDKLVARGQTYFDFLKSVPVHLVYEGPTWSHRVYPNAWKKEPKQQYDGEFIIDPSSFQRYASESPITVGRDYSPVRRRSVSSSSSVSDDDTRELHGTDDDTYWADYDEIDPQTQTSLTERHLFLLPRRIDGFALKTKRWLGIDVDRTKPLQWSPDEGSAMSQLILPRRDIEIIKALSSRHANGKSGTWGADFIPGKGEGQVFLLHGPPGTGKTYTVECVADYTRRPLVSLTVADIGTDEVRMEANLSRWFTVAASWQAIILIDEADVFLEKRQIANLQRNSLVSVFLRCMEYYPGMLFLTTNRIGQIDDAFLSRTSVALTYEPLNSSVQLRVWEGFLAKLERERSDIIVTDRARTFLEEDKDMNSIQWNGREIRNALQTAIALAVHDAEEDFKRTGRETLKIEIDRDHFAKVLQRRKTFIDYRDSIKRQNEEQRALGEGSRALPKRG